MHGPLLRHYLCLNQENSMLGFHELKPNAKSKKKSKRVGRGNASGHGTYSTRGLKGQKARSGGGNRLKQKGWRHLLLSSPKLRGFHSLYQKKGIVNLEILEKNFSSGETVSPATLREKGLVTKNFSGIKILSKGALTKKLEINNCLVSETAKEKIIKAGGQIK